MLDSDLFDRDRTRLYKYIEQIRDMSNSPNNIVVRTTDWIPSCSMIIVQENLSKAKAKIVINSPVLKLPVDNKIRDRRCLIFSRDEYPDDFEYFYSQFELLWENAKVVA